MDMHTSLRDTVLRGLRMGQLVQVTGHEGARCTITGWAAADPFGPDTVQVRVDTFDLWGRVRDTFYADVARDSVRAWDQ